MNKITKSTLLISTALLAWLAGGGNTLAMQMHKPPVDLSTIEIPSAAKASQPAFFEFLDSLKNGQNDSIIEGAKQKYTGWRQNSHLLKMNQAMQYLRTAQVSTKEHSRELEKSRGQLQEQQQKFQKITAEKEAIEKEKSLVEKAFQATAGLTPEEMEDFISKLQKSLSGFSDALFLMKFSGDQNKDFSSTLGKIIVQAQASKKIKDAYEADKKIKKLEIYLQLPTDPVDTTPFVKQFKEGQIQLTREIYKKYDDLKGIVEMVKDKFENIENAPGFSQLSEEVQKKFRQYLYGKTEEMDEFGFVKYNDKYKNIFINASDTIKFFNNFLGFLKGNFNIPIDFKMGFEDFKNKNLHLLSSVFDSVVGEEDTESESTLLINKSGLSLYRYLNLQLKALKRENPLVLYIEDLLQSIDFMRVRAFELANEIEEGKKFIKSGGTTGEPSLSGTGVKSLLDVVNTYEISEGENALLENLQRFIVPHREQWVDYEKLKEFKIMNDAEDKKILGDLEKFSQTWMNLINSRKQLYEAKKSKALAEIVQSNLYDNVTKDELIAETNRTLGLKQRTAKIRLDGHLAKIVKTVFKDLGIKNEKLKKTLKLFGEKIDTTKARDVRNSAIEKANADPLQKDKKKAEDVPPLTLENMELTGIIQSFVNANKNLSFDQFWELEEKNQNSMITNFLSALSLKASQDEFKLICQILFKWVQENTAEKRSLTSLFEKVIVAHDYHIDFMKKMGVVDIAFKALEFDLPKYTLEQQSIENKVRQLATLIAQKPGGYLLLEPDDRAVNYAYNFPMFSDKSLQPLKPEMEIWGTASRANIDQLLKALTDAHEAYQTARDAIVAINLQAEDRGKKAKLFGGFDQEIIEEVNSPVVEGGPGMTEEGQPPMQKGSPPPMPGGPPPPVPGGLGIQAVSGNLIKVCNECVVDIENLVKLKVLTPEREAEITHQDAEEKEKKIQELLYPYIATAKGHILEGIGVLLEEDFNYLDQPVPNEAKIEEIIVKSCADMKINMDAMIITVNEEATQKRGPGQRRLRAVQPGAHSQPGAPAGSPFNVILKRHKAPVQNVVPTEIEKAEQEITVIQPVDKSLVAQKQADQNRLEKIKAFLTTEKGPDFIAKFTEPELLAFQLHVLIDLNPEDLENNRPEGFEGRKFSSKALEYIKDIRFSKDPGTRIVAEVLTAEQVRKTAPKELLAINLSMNNVRIQELLRNDQLR